jgi:putative IMPACT (imprinted ancient) family translation regulator
VNLGTSGLIVAYKTAASEALKNSDILTKHVEEEIKYTFTYPMMNDVMRIVKEMEPKIVSQNFDTTCSITLSIRKSKSDLLKKKLQQLSFE